MRRLQNPSFPVQQHQIGMPSHDLQHQTPRFPVTHFSHGIHIDMDNPVPSDLAYAQHPPAQQLLAHQHAQGRGLQRIGKAAPRQMASGVVRRGTKQQAPVFIPRPDHQDHRIPLRLGNPVNPSSRQHLIQLPGDISHHQPVHRHGHLLLRHGSSFPRPSILSASPPPRKRKGRIIQASAGLQWRGFYATIFPG